MKNFQENCSTKKSTSHGVCTGKPWADVAFVGDMHSSGLGETVGQSNELSREQQAAYKVILAIDGQAWASCWEWGLASGSVLVHVGVWTMHAHTELQPWVHFVPCEKVDDLEKEMAALGKKGKAKKAKVGQKGAGTSYQWQALEKMDATGEEDGACPGI